MAGEMHQNDLEKGGEWHDVRLALEDICESAGIKCTVKPFDYYQGPYALLPNGGKLWIDHHCTDPEYEYNYFYYEGKGGNKKGSGKEIIEHLTKVCPQPKLIHKQPEKSEKPEKSPLRDPKNIKLDPLGKKEFIQKRSTPEERKHLRLIKSALRKIIAGKMTEEMTKKALNDYQALLGKTVLLHGAYTSAYSFDLDPPKKFKVLETDKENILHHEEYENMIWSEYNVEPVNSDEILKGYPECELEDGRLVRFYCLGRRYNTDTGEVSGGDIDDKSYPSNREKKFKGRF